MQTVRIGSRGSDLALWQAHHVRDLIEARGFPTELTIIKTTGDRIDDVPFSKMAGKGFFTKELEDAQLDRRVDLAVHSMKDMTTEEPPGLALGAMIGREDARDLLLARNGVVSYEAGRVLPVRQGARVGTSSARRQALARFHAPTVELVDLRGNVPTRIQKLRDGHYDAIIIACAGVARLGLDVSDLDAVPLDPTHFVPAPAQGMLAIQCRDEAWLRELLLGLHTAEAARSVAAERWLLEKLEGGCLLPFGCHIRPIETGRLTDPASTPVDPTERLTFELDLFLEVAPQAPLTLHLEGAEPRVLAEEAWAVVEPYRGLARAVRS